MAQSAALDPVRATLTGVGGHDEQLTDYSPEGAAARAEHDRRSLGELGALTPTDEAERRAAAVLRERLSVSLEMAAADEHLRALRNLASPVQLVRQVFDLMPRATDEDWRTLARRMAGVPAALEALRASYDRGIARGVVAARRQALVAAEQAATWGDERGESFFAALAGEHGRRQRPDPRLQGDLETAAAAATGAYRDLARYLREVYAPQAAERDAVGAQRYARHARAALGAEIDLHETYAWGWEELRRIEREMQVTAERILPGHSVAEVIDHLENDPAGAVEGEENLRRWLQDLMDRTVEELDGRHFDIPEPIRRVEAMIAPPGGAAAMYYTPPSEDLSRPGRTWYPTLGKTRFPLWGEVSIAYHEGVPGHHLQLGQVRYLREKLSRFQRTISIPGHSEGWALYAERLMDELGYLERPEHRLGMLRAQVMRAVRVVVDLGMHLELEIPADEPFAPGQRWTPELGERFVVERSCFPADFMASEIVRYLGWPAQAISYKVGERVLLEVRDAARQRSGASFDLKAFHQQVLDAGPLGLDLLRGEVDA